MKLNKFVLLVLFLFFVSSVYAYEYEHDLQFFDAKCEKDGSLELHIDSINPDDRVYTENISLNASYYNWYGLKQYDFEFDGEWDQKYVRRSSDRDKQRAIFSTNEAVFNEQGTYIVFMEYNSETNSTWKYLNHSFECPGLIFSCTLLHVGVKSCKTIDNKYFETVLDLRGLNQSEFGALDLYEDFEYGLVADKPYEDIKGEFSSSGSLPKGVKEGYRDGIYHLNYEFEDNFIKTIVVKLLGYPGCRDTKLYDLNLYSYKECEIVESEKDVEEEKESEIIVPVEINTTDIQEEKESSSNILIYGILITVILILIIIIFVILKKQKTNKWV